MKQQISKVVVKEFQIDFEWIIKDLWSYKWETGQFLLSDELELNEVKVKSPIKFYPYDDRFEFLYFDHSAEGCKYGNAKVDVFLDQLKFTKGARKDFFFQASSEEIDSFYDEDLDGFRFPFKISYNVCCYRSKDNEDKIEKIIDETLFEDEEIDDSDNEDNSFSYDYKRRSADEGDGFEIIDQNDEKPHESAVTASFSANSDQGKEEEKESFSECSIEVEELEEDQGNVPNQSTIKEPEVQKYLDSKSRRVVQKLFGMSSSFADIIIDHYKEYSTEEKITVLMEVSDKLKPENFYEVLDCADFWNCGLMKRIVAMRMAHHDTKELINSDGFKKLQNNHKLYALAKKIISDAFINKEINSPIVFFL